MKLNGFPPLALMKQSGAILKDALLLAEETVEPGITTRYIDSVVDGFIRSNGARPAFLGYDGFPACCCISVNAQVVHGAPSDLVLNSGDIVSVDCGVILDGAYTDSCRTFPVGDIKAEDKELLSVTLGALRAGIEKAVSGNRVGEISFAVQKFVETSGFNVSRQFVGHSIGYDLHMKPWIPNYGTKKSGELLKSGMFIAIEPIVFSGSWNTIQKGEWNIVSKDGCRSAHFEDTIYIGEEGMLVIT